MFPGLFELGRSMQPHPMPVRSRVLSLATILLVTAVIATSIIGFVHLSAQQHALSLLRDQSLKLQSLRETLVEANTDVLQLVAGDTSVLPDYFDKAKALDSGRIGILGELNPVTRPGTTEAGEAAPVVEALVSSWNEAARLASLGDLEAANAVLRQSRAGETLNTLTVAADRVLANADREFRMHEDRIRFGTLLVLVLQLGGGTLAIFGLIFAFRSSVLEANGRAAAVASADASREQVARLFEMADVLQSASDHTDANSVLKATAADLVPGFSGALYVFNNSRDRLVLSTAWARPSEERLPETVNPASCWALKRGKPHVNRAGGTKLCCAHHSGSETVLEIPMIARGEIVGLLQLFASGDDAEARLEGVTDLGSALADGMSLALANMALREKLRNQALRDPLTGLYNRRFMEDSLQRFVRLAERENREISLLMVDLDHFKRLNDEHGHAFGDQVLRDTAMTLVSSLRETDIVCRFGGEELVVILPDCPLERAADKAELLRERIEALSETHGAEISASFGVACLPHTSQSVTDLLTAADAALYKAKQNGRNQVATAPLRAYRLDRVVEDVAEEAGEFPRAAAE